MTNKFKQLKEGTKNEIAELMSKFDYVNTPKDEIEIDMDKDLSKFSNLSNKTKKEIAELSINDDYESGKNPKQVNPSGFDGFRIMKIQEFVADEQRRMKQFMSQSDEEIKQAEKDFAERELMRNNLGMQNEGIEHKFKAAEMNISGSEKDKMIQDYITSANTISEQINRAIEITGKEDVKARLLSVLKLDKEKKYYK